MPHQRVRKSISGSAILLATLLIAFFSGKPTACAQSLDTEPPTAITSGVSVAEALNTIGHETGIKFAIEDRILARDGKPVRELSTTRIPVDLKPGTCRQQLLQLAASLENLTWFEGLGVIWIVNKRVTPNSPLVAWLDEANFEGKLNSDLSPFLHDQDPRIPDSTMLNGISEHWSPYPVKIALKNTTVRRIYSAVLRQTHAVGLVMEFVEFNPSEIVLPSAKVSTNNADAGVHYFWQLLKNPNGD